MEKKFELTKDILKEILEAKEEKFTLEEIEQLMNSEVEKPEEEMDTELVDMCASILAKAYNPDYKDEKPAEMFRPWEMDAAETAVSEKPKKKVIPFKRVLIVAAAVALVIVAFFALPAGATLFDNEASDKIIKFYDDHFEINFNGEETTQNEDDWINQLILENLHTRMLPQALLDEKYEKKPVVQQSDDMTTIYIQLTNETEKIYGNILITEYKNENINAVNGQVNVSNMYRYFKQLTINSKEIIVFSNGEGSYINYSDGSTNYEISLGCDFDTMVSIAETINVKG